MAQGLNPTAQIRAAAETRRYQMLELHKGGATERQIAEALGVDKALVHRDIKRVLNDLAQKYSGVADQVRGLQMERYTTLLSRWWSPALNGDAEATSMVLKIMHRISEINGVIPKEPLITIDSRSINLTQGEVTFSIEAASDINANEEIPEGSIPPPLPVSETGSRDILS
jgi:uncharacterized protein YpbB